MIELRPADVCKVTIIFI